MLPKQNRLKRKKDFERVFDQGKSLKEDFLFFRTACNELDENRFGFIVSNKVSKKATERNKIKRRIRESVRLRLKEMANSKKIDGIFIALASAKKKEFKSVQEAVDKLLRKSGLLE